MEAKYGGCMCKYLMKYKINKTVEVCIVVVVSL